MKYSPANTLCLEYHEFVQIVPSKGTFDSLKARGNIVVYGRGGNGSTVLIEIDTLPAKYKAAVIEKLGDPKKYVVTQPIRELFTLDLKAEQFYRDYTLPNGLKLPDQDFDLKGKPQTNYVKRYTNAASYLNLIGYLTNDKKALKEQLNVSLATFWERVFDLLRAENIKLPLSEKRIKIALKEYKDKGYASLIEEFRFGNSNSKKVDDDVAEALLIEMLSHDHQHDYTRVALAYNAWAKEAGKETITNRAVAYWAKKNAHLITQSRNGVAINYNKFNKQIRRNRPTAPMLLINSDDNVLDLYFIEEKVNKKNHVVKNHYYRPVLYVVTDAYNDYILGYAIGETVTIELIKEAYRNAQNHIKQVLNGYYLPHQLQTDRWGLGKGNDLENFYKSIGEFTPATVKVAQGKYIERTFGVTWHQNLKCFVNYAGNNVTAKEKLNPDAIDRNKSNFPAKASAPTQVALFIEAMRDTVNPKTGISRREEWAAAFVQSDKSKERAISLEQHLQIFGVLHEPKNGRKNRLMPQGLEIMDRKFVYDIPASYFPQCVNKEVHVYYDPNDMNSVLVTDGKGIRFVAHSYVKSPSALADHTEETQRTYWKRMSEKKAIAAVPGEAQTNRRDILSRAQIDAESLLQGGVLVKQIRHNAEKAVKGAYEDIEDSLSLPVETETKKDSKNKW